MAEEVENAALTIPRAICAGMIINGLTGFAMMLTTLYCLGDVDSVLDTKTGFPFLQIFLNSVESRAGAVGMGSIVLILTWSCALGITTTASRMTWSFARDKGTPLSKFISKVDPRTQVPIVAVVVISVFAALLVLIYVGSYTAFNDVISLTITGFYGSYFLPCALMLYHRVKGTIYPYHRDDEPESSEKTGEQLSEPTKAKLTWGPWHIPGILGIINNGYACVYMVFVIFWSVWPAETPVTANTMNYSVVVTGGVLILSGIWYWVRARKEYHGPILEEDVPEGARRQSIIARETAHETI
jgi:choline transport protein